MSDATLRPIAGINFNSFRVRAALILAAVLLLGIIGIRFDSSGTLHKSR